MLEECGFFRITEITVYHVSQFLLYHTISQFHITAYHTSIGVLGVLSKGWGWGFVSPRGGDMEGVIWKCGMKCDMESPSSEDSMVKNKLWG